MGFAVGSLMIEIKSCVGQNDESAHNEESASGCDERGVSGEELLRRFHGGDMTAFEDLVALYDNGLYLYINGIVRDRYEAKHLTIETFSELALSGGGFKGKSSLKTYLYAIGKNLAARHMKRRERENHVSSEEIFNMLAAGGETVDGFLEREESRRSLHEAMQDLKVEHRAVLSLLYFEDMSYIEAGKAMNRSEAQIKSLAHRAKAALKRKLESGGFARV